MRVSYQIATRDMITDENNFLRSENYLDGKKLCIDFFIIVDRKKRTTTKKNKINIVQKLVLKKQSFLL